MLVGNSTSAKPTSAKSVASVAAANEINGRGKSNANLIGAHYHHLCHLRHLLGHAVLHDASYHFVETHVKCDRPC